MQQLVSNNDCSYNRVAGIRLSSNGNTLTGNKCIQNYRYGIEVYGSRYNIITQNTISENYKYGINFIYGCKYNRIHHNTFIDNNHNTTNNPLPHQAYDQIQNMDFWNDSGQGNYWSDWTAPDKNGDGIVDSPYIIDGDNNAKDYYPLVNPIKKSWLEQNLPVIAGVTILIIILLLAVFFIKRQKTPSETKTGKVKHEQDSRENEIKNKI